MNTLNGLNFGLGSIPLLSNAATRSISAENPTGAVGGGAQAVPDEKNAGSLLGQGWKVRPCITLEPQTTTTLADIEGPGVIQHIWITVARRPIVVRAAHVLGRRRDPVGRGAVGRLFRQRAWLRYNVASLPIAVNPWVGSTATGRCPSAAMRASPSRTSTGSRCSGFLLSDHLCSGRGACRGGLSARTVASQHDHAGTPRAYAVGRRQGSGALCGHGTGLEPVL
jgi:hypothetical protein